ncbi:hypothetical protein TNCV_3607021 [Trichonephila clavipes]|nr:hypothetical protein TNCV_3607021 [Trichonephila clavipes]
MVTIMCRLKTHQQGCKQAEALLSAYVVVRLMPNSDPVYISRLCGDLPGDSTTCLELIPQPEDYFQATSSLRATSP